MYRRLKAFFASCVTKVGEILPLLEKWQYYEGLFCYLQIFKINDKKFEMESGSFLKRY